MTFYDKNGTELAIGDHIVPDAGEELVIMAQGKVDDYEDEIMTGYQVNDITCYSILTQENLAAQWTKVEE